MDFDVIPYEDITWGQRLGSGSFGSVFRGQRSPFRAGLSIGETDMTGSYLGIDIAIKEVLPSTEYDVHKYFEREWRIMRECRHPNIVLFLGLSKAPGSDGRVFIISEFVPRGNLRQHILSSRPFPWRLRLSFATDVARAVAYLHARQCIHRDLKGENLLITSNERIKVTDFGFARIASRNADEMKRMTYCGTDGYMSPEIINGFEFDLPTDVFSLGVIFIEIFCRRLVDSKNFTRQPPSFVPDAAEVLRRASPGCPTALIDLALECCAELPAARPLMPAVLSRLRAIELDVLSRLDKETEHVGSIKLSHHGGKRAMPIFEPLKPMEVVQAELKEAEKDEEADDDVKKMEEDAIDALAKLQVDGRGATGVEQESPDAKETWRTARWEERPSILTNWAKPVDIASNRDEPKGPGEVPTVFPIPAPLSIDAPTSTRNPPTAADLGSKEDTSSTMTVRASPTSSSPPPAITADASAEAPSETSKVVLAKVTDGVVQPASVVSDSSSHRPHTPTLYNRSAPTSSGTPKLKTKAELADEEASKNAQPPAHGTHRFTLIDKEALQLLSGKKPSTFPSTFAAFLPKSLAPSSRCPVCHKRLGQRPALQCDDCSIIVHVNCSHAAERNCSTS